MTLLLFLYLLIFRLNAQCGTGANCRNCLDQPSCDAITGVDGCRWDTSECITAACDIDCPSCSIPECDFSLANCVRIDTGGGEECLPVTTTSAPTTIPTSNPSEIPTAVPSGIPTNDPTEAVTTTAPITTGAMSTAAITTTSTTLDDMFSSMSTIFDSDSDSSDSDSDSMESTNMGSNSDSDSWNSDSDSDSSSEESESFEIFSTILNTLTSVNDASSESDDLNSISSDESSESSESSSGSLNIVNMIDDSVSEDVSNDPLLSESADGTLLEDNMDENGSQDMADGDDRRVANIRLDEENMAQSSYNESAKLVGLSVVASTCVFMVVALVIGVWCYYGKKGYMARDHVEIKHSEDEEEEEEEEEEDMEEETEFAVMVETK